VDQAIAIYSLTVEETPETITTEEAMSQVLPYWDDDVPQPQPQSQSQSQSSQQTYTTEEAQELVEKAFQEGWQQGMEEGYKLGKDKGYKEYKIVQEEEEAKKTKKRANEATTTAQDVCSTPTSLETSPSTNFGNPTVEIAKVEQQAVPGGTECSLSLSTANSDLKLLLAVPRSPTSSTTPTFSSPNVQIAEIAHTATYNSSTSSNSTQTAHLNTENPSNDVSNSYVVYFDPQIASSINQSNREKNCPQDTHIPESIQSNGGNLCLVDVDIQEPSPASGTSPDTEKTPPTTSHISTLSPRLPPLPNFQLLDPTPHKQMSAPLETSHTLTEAHNDTTLPEKSTTCLFNKTGTQADYPTVATPGTPLTHVPTLQCSPTTSLESSSITIHAQTVIINNYSTAGSFTTSKKNGSTFFNNDSAAHPMHSTRNSEDKPQAPVSPTTSAMPPRNLSVLRSCHHRPFSSLQRRSRRCQSVPVRGHNWDKYFHHRDFSRARGWAPTVY
jgi:hypothetical protein